MQFVLADHSQKKFRLVIVIEALDRGGAEWHLLQTLPHLKSRDFDIEIFCLRHRGELADEMERRGIVVHGYAASQNSLLIRLVQVAVRAFGLFFYLLRYRPHIVHFILPAAYIAGAPAAVLARSRIRIMSRRSLNNYHSHMIGSKFIERQWHRRMSGVLGNSQSVIDQLKNEGIPETKLHLIYNGVDFSIFGHNVTRDDARSRLGLSSEALVFVIVANLIPYKGHADLLHAFALISDRMPQNWVLLCAGRDDGIGSNLQDLVEKLGLTQRVHWLGSVKDVPSLLTAADVALLASHEEGFSNAIIEYMATGLPAIVTNVGGNAEAIENGKSGFVVPARDPAAMADAILELSLDPDKRLRMGAYAQESARRQYSLESCVNSYLTFYKKILSDHGMG
ncbi:MAG: glycosyltransferase [Ferrovibrio sp.]